MRSTASQTSQDIQKLRAEVVRLGTIVKGMPAHAAQDAGNVIGFDKKELRKMARDAGKKTRRYISDKKEQATELYGEAEDTIQSNPFRSVGAALLSGVLIGAILRRF